MDEQPGRGEPLRLPAFRRFWVAETVSEFGTYVTTIALQVLIVLVLSGTALDVGLVSASRWLPYLLLGVLVGALVDRGRRKPVLVVTDLARAALLCVIPLLWWMGWLSIWSLMAVVLLFGTASVVNDAATQSFLPRLVERGQLLPANARLDQSSAVAQLAGPLAGGGLVGLVGAPLAVLADAISFVVSAIVTAGIRVVEPVAELTRRHLGREIGDGLRWIYRHPTLAPLAVSSHLWFLVNSMGSTILVPLALLVFGFSPLELGIVVAAAGAGALAGASLSVRAGRRWGPGRVVIASHAAMPVAWAGVLVLVLQGQAEHLAAIAVIVASQALIGFAMGLENANEMGYWQAVTPDALQGRTNATRRSANRAMIVIGAPLGGLIADRLGYPAAITIVIAGFVLAVVVLLLSPFRNARHE